MLILVLLACPPPEDSGRDSAARETGGPAGCTAEVTVRTAATDAVVTREYDDDGHLVVETADEGDTVRTWSWSGACAVARQEAYLGGASAYTVATVTACDEHDWPVHDDVVETIGDTVLDYVFVYTNTYDGDHPRRVDTAEGDSDADAVVVQILELTWLTDGLLASTALDGDANGRADIVTNWTYDALDREVLRETDQDVDLAPDATVATTWRGDSTRQDVETYDDEADGTVDATHTWTWDCP